MATIQKISSHGWRIYWRLYFPDGTNKTKYKTSHSKSTLQELLPDVMKIETLSRRLELTAEDLLKAVNLRIIDRDEAGAFGRVLEGLGTHYLEDLRQDLETKLKVSASSDRALQIDLYKAGILEEWFKTIPLGQISPETIERFREERHRKWTASTVNQDLKLLRKYLDIAVNKGWIRENQARKVKLMREIRNTVPRCLYPDELKTLFDRIGEFKHWLKGDFEFIVRAFIYSGLRRSEMINLKPEDVKLHLRQIHVTGKGKKVRVVGIHHSLMEEFERRVEREYILEPIREESVSRAVKSVFRKLGLPGALTLHSLRHTYISYLLEAGVPTKRVKELAGHFSLAVTDRYTHALPKDAVDEDLLDFEKRQ